MPEGQGGVVDTFRYKVELDTQGLASQLASVRDVVSQGLGQAGRAVVGGAEVAGAAANRLSSDLIMGQQALSGSFSAQMAMPSMGVASTTLAGVPGMPQTFGQEIAAVMGLSRAPVGVFPSQFQAVAMQRLNERAQQATVAAGAGVVSMGAGMAGGAVLGGILGSVVPGVGNVVGAVVGGIAGSMLADTAMAPLISGVQERMAERARVQQIFGWNTFNDDQRTAMAGFMRQQSVNSIMSPEQFNQVLPSAVRAGFFRGVQPGDVAGFRRQFELAERELTQDMYALQLTDVAEAGRLRQGMRRFGVTEPQRAREMISQSRVLAQEMMTLGEYTDPTEMLQSQMDVGEMAAQAGLAPRLAMQAFRQQSMTMARLNAAGRISPDDIALMGGTTTAAAQRMTGAMMGAQRSGFGRVAMLAFGEFDPTTGRAGINRAALDRFLSGGEGIAGLSQMVSQRLATGRDGMDRIAGVLANPNAVNAELLPFQGQIMKSFIEDITAKQGLDIGPGMRQLIMQRTFGVDEVAGRALMQGAEGQMADQKLLEERGQKLDQDVKNAVATAQGNFSHSVDVFTRSIKEGFAEHLDGLTKAIADKVTRPIEVTNEHLTNIEQRVGPGGYSSRSPITVGPIQFSGEGDWMTPKDPMSLQGFRSVMESRRYPEPMISMKAMAPMIPNMTRLAGPRETMAG